jgi:hypothetical protein
MWGLALASGNTDISFRAHYYVEAKTIYITWSGTCMEDGEQTRSQRVIARSRPIPLTREIAHPSQCRIYTSTVPVFILIVFLIMISKTSVLALCLLVTGSLAIPSLQARQVTNECPTDTEYACFDVINSSLCLSTNTDRGGTAEQFAACVDYPGTFNHG